MNTKLICTGTLMLWGVLSHAQTKPADTVIIKVGEGSRIIVAVQKEDLEIMKQYDFQKLMTDLIVKLEQKDTISQQAPSAEYLKEPVQEGVVTAEENTNDRSVDENWENNHKHDKWHHRRTYHSINFDLGMNNYL